MVGTSEEVLLQVFEDSRYAEMLFISRQRMYSLRGHLKAGDMSYTRQAELLTKCGAKMLRERFDLPAIVRDHKGRFYTELSLLLMVEPEHQMSDLNLNKVCSSIRQGQFPKKETVREVLRRKGWTMFRERETIPAIWQIDLLR